jgi:hypothetical protein
MKEQSQTLPILGVFSLRNPCHHFRKSLDIKELAILPIEIGVIILALGPKMAMRSHSYNALVVA